MNNPTLRFRHLYKHCSISDEFRNTKKLICNSTIRLNSPDEFNDPFDLQIIPRADIHNSELRNWIELQIKNPINEQNKSKIINLLQSGDYKIPSFRDGIIEGALEMGIKTHGVYCFSKIWDSILMWSHYANRHKGICICFNFNEQSSIAKYLNDVIYSDRYPQIYINDSDDFKLFFLTKFLAWKYEYEVRIIKPNACGEFIQLNENEIEAIIFGIKSSEEEIDNVIKWINAREYKPKLFKAIKPLRDYKIDKIPIEYFPSISGKAIIDADYSHLI
jgi:hypothetical protein